MDHSFFRWLMVRRSRAVLELIIAVSIAFVFLQILSVSAPLRENIQYSVPAAANLVVIMILLTVVISARPLDSEKFRRESRAALRFYKVWAVVWIVWFLLYAVSMLSNLIPVQLARENHWIDYWGITLNLLNNIQSALILQCYFLLSPPVVREREVGSFISIVRPLLSSLLLLFVAELGTRTLLQDQPWVGMFFSLVSSVGAGLSLALLTGRFQSEKFGTPTFVLTLFYLNAVLQTVFLLQDVSLQMFILWITIPLKLILFLFVYWLLTSGRLHFYFYRAADTLLTESRWSKFLGDLMESDSSFIKWKETAKWK